MKSFQRGKDTFSGSDIKPCINIATVCTVVKQVCTLF